MVGLHKGLVATAMQVAAWAGPLIGLAWTHDHCLFVGTAQMAGQLFNRSNGQQRRKEY